ncbi:MAG TPA: ribosome silencing factor [Polyangiaceae bacterium]
MATKKTSGGGSKTPKKTTTRSEEKGALAPGGGRPRLRSSHGGQSKSVRAPSELAPPKRGATKKPGRPTGESPSVASDEARELATLIAVAALDKKAVGLEILDVAGKVDYADFLVLMTGRSDRQVAALTQGIEEALRKKNKRPISVEGMPHANWVLMDYGDVVVHVFQDEARGLYDLEGLWTDARRLPVPLPDGAR